MNKQATNLFRPFLTLAWTLGLLTAFATAAPVGQNLLTNAGFEDYLVNGWGDVHPPWGRGSKNSDPAPYEGDYYLKLTTSVPDASISQEFDLVALGFDSHRLETGGYRVDIEGAMYTGNTQTAGIIWLGQYVGSDYEETNVVQRKSPDWRVKSGTVYLQPGTTKVTYKFQAVTDSSSVVNEAYLDAACLKVRDNTIWAYGDVTDAFQANNDYTTSGDFVLAKEGTGEVNITHGRTWTTDGEVTTLGHLFYNVTGTVNIASGTWQANGIVYAEDYSTMVIKITDNGTWNSAEPAVFNGSNSIDAAIDIVSGQWNSLGKVWIAQMLPGEGYEGRGNVRIGEDGVWNSTGVVTIGAGSHSVNGGAWNASTVYLGDGKMTWEDQFTLTLRDGGLLKTSGDLFVGCISDRQTEIIGYGGRFISNGMVHVGYAEEATGYVDLNSGSSWTSNHEVRIGEQDCAEGKVTLFDNSNWTANGDVFVGFGGLRDANVKIIEGSTWSTQAEGSAVIGLHADGHVVIDSGGKWYAQGTTQIGSDADDSDARGDVLITNSSLFDMAGELTVSERGLLRIESGSTARLRGAWTNNGSILLESGLLSIEHSGTLAGINIKGSALSILGTNTILDTGNATVGAYCTMSIDQGATVFVDSGRFFNVDGTLKMPNGDGTIRINNGTLKCGGKQVLLGGGTIEGSGQIFVGMKGLDLGVDGAINGTSPSKGFVVWGNLSGSGELNNVTLYGDLDVGNSPGTIEVGGLALSSSGSLTMELGGLVPGTEYDQILVSGTFTLDGTLEVLWYNDFEASAGDTFTLFDVTAGGSLDGQFDNILLPTFSEASLHWDTSNLYTDGTISAVPEPMTWVLLLGLGAMAFVRRRIH